MKPTARMTLIAVATALAIGQAARAAEHRHACNESVLAGLYVFNATGFNVAAGVAVPKAIVEFIRFNGDGTLSVPAATRSVNGIITRSPANGVGTYAIAPDCTGTVTFGPPGPTFDVFIVPGGEAIRLIQLTDPTQAGPVLQGSAHRIAD